MLNFRWLPTVKIDPTKNITVLPKNVLTLNKNNKKENAPKVIDWIHGCKACIGFHAVSKVDEQKR